MIAIRLKGSATRTFLSIAGLFSTPRSLAPATPSSSQLEMEFVFHHHHQPLIAQHYHGAASRQARQRRPGLPTLRVRNHGAPV